MPDRQVTNTRIAAARLIRDASRKLGEPVEPWIEELADLPYSAGPPVRVSTPGTGDAPDDQAEAGSTR